MSRGLGNKMFFKIWFCGISFYIYDIKKHLNSKMNNIVERFFCEKQPTSYFLLNPINSQYILFKNSVNSVRFLLNSYFSVSNCNSIKQQNYYSAINEIFMFRWNKKNFLEDYCCLFYEWSLMRKNMSQEAVSFLLFDVSPERKW